MAGACRGQFNEVHRDELTKISINGITIIASIKITDVSSSLLIDFIDLFKQNLLLRQIPRFESLVTKKKLKISISLTKMMKSYLRYEPSKSFGVIAAPQCNIMYDFSGNLAITGALQNICVWNLRQASQVAKIMIIVVLFLLVSHVN